MSVILSVDLGFGWTKGISFTKEATFPSVIGTSRQLVNSEINEQDYTKHITCIDGDKEYFVGDLAIRQSPFKFFSLKESKPDNEDTKILLKTILGLLLPDPPNQKIKLVTGLPVTFYFEQKDKMSKLCTQKHEIKLKISNQNIDNEIEIVQTKIVPQPLGSFMDWLLDDSAQIKTDRKHIILGTIGIVDIGFYTTDYLVVRKLEVLHEYSRSTRSGISLALKNMSDFGIDLPLYILDKEITAGNYKEIKEKTFKLLVQQIEDEIDTFLPSKLDLIIITGGGGFALYKYFNFNKSILAENANISNARGYLKLGRRVFK